MSTVHPSVHGHRKRLRARFAAHGLDAFRDDEALELLLTYAIPRRDVKPTAKALLARFGTLAEVFDATVAELSQVEGVGEQAALLVKLVRALWPRYLQSGTQPRPLLRNPDDVAALLRALLQGRRHECFGAIFADTQLRVLATEILFEGTIDRAPVYPREIVKRALELDAAALFLFHNHPGGSCRPSSEDIAITRRIEEACRPLGLRLEDHFLVADREVASFRERGWWIPKA